VTQYATSYEIGSAAASLEDAAAVTCTVAPALFFPALTTLRFFAAFAVLIHHIELYKKRCGIENVFDAFLIQQLGQQSINLFFVLSSFLLTTLLLREAERTQTIDVRRFYVRRILRIWPVYGVIVFIAFLIVPLCAPRILTQHELKHFETTTPFLTDALLLYLLMLPNFCAVFFTRFIAASHLWSVAVEEQFYLFWPLLNKAFRRRPLVLLVVFYLASAVVGNVAHILPTLDWEKELPLSQLQLWNIYCVCECVNSLALCFRMMLFGAAAAVMFAGGYYRVLYRGSARILILAGITALMVIPYSRSDVPLGILFALLIVSLTDCRIKLLASRPLVYLGSISYGIYMYHAIVLQCLMKCAENFDPSTSSAFVYLTALPAVLAISALSYRFFERPFLQLKDKLAIVKNGTI
jgi:peptidoglycan/LPS O-acetylase OafA/YrhL